MVSLAQVNLPCVPGTVPEGGLPCELDRGLTVGFWGALLPRGLQRLQPEPEPEPEPEPRPKELPCPWRDGACLRSLGLPAVPISPHSPPPPP